VLDGIPNAEYVRRICKHREKNRKMWAALGGMAIPPEKYRPIYQEVTEILGGSYEWRLLRAIDKTVNDARIGDALRALFAYPDCTYMFDLHPDAVKVLAACDNPAAALLYPVLVLLHEGNTDGHTQAEGN